MNRGVRHEWSLIAGLIGAGLWLGGKKTMAAAVGGGALGLRLFPSKPYRFSQRSVLITGGSRGLGLALAETFLRKGANVTLLARDTEELRRAEEHLSKLQKDDTTQILTIPCDITNPEALERAFHRSQERFGRLDILVNNAGSISVGPFGAMQDEDFTAQLDLQLQAVIHAVRLALPIFQEAGEGRIVNISSIGGQVPVPHMSTYCASKFALAGLSETLTAELAPMNIKVTTVYPGLMQTGSPIQAVFKGDHEKEYAWFAAGDVMPGLSVSALSAARRIVSGVRHGDARVAFPAITRLGAVVHSVLPETYAFTMRQAAGMMPKDESPVRKTGAQSQGWLEAQPWYQPLRKVEERAEHRFNQTEKFDADFNMGIKKHPLLEEESPS